MRTRTRTRTETDHLLRASARRNGCIRCLISHRTDDHFLAFEMPGGDHCAPERSSTRLNKRNAKLLPMQSVIFRSHILLLCCVPSTKPHLLSLTSLLISPPSHPLHTPPPLHSLPFIASSTPPHPHPHIKIRRPHKPIILRRPLPLPMHQFKIKLTHNHRHHFTNLEDGNVSAAASSRAEAELHSVHRISG